MITSADQLACLLSADSVRVYSDSNKPHSKFVEVTNIGKTKKFELHYDLKDKLTKVTRENGERTLKKACSDFLGQSSCAKLRAYYSTHEKPADTVYPIDSKYTVTKLTSTETLPIDDQIADTLTEEALELISTPLGDNSNSDQIVAAYKLAIAEGDFELAKMILEGAEDPEMVNNISDGVVDFEFDFLNGKVDVTNNNDLDNVSNED